VSQVGRGSLYPRRSELGDEGLGHQLKGLVPSKGYEFVFAPPEVLAWGAPVCRSRGKPASTHAFKPLRTKAPFALRFEIEPAYVRGAAYACMGIPAGGGGVAVDVLRLPISEPGLT